MPASYIDYDHIQICNRETDGQIDGQTDRTDRFTMVIPCFVRKFISR